MQMKDVTKFSQKNYLPTSSNQKSDPQGLLVLDGVTKRYADGLVAVDKINLRIEPGTYCCLLGPSGCGKSTILRMIAGHETISGGSIFIDGNNVNGKSPRERGTAMMFQNYALFPHLSVRDNVAFSLQVRGIEKKTRLFEADKVIEQVQLTALANRLPAQLSGGQQQRVALARSIILRPKVLLLDEPLSSLDEFLRLQMRGELRSMQRELGITFIHVTHTQLEAIAVADQVVVMQKGHVAQSASPLDIYTRPRTEYVANFLGGQNVFHGEVAAVTSGESSTVTLKGSKGMTFVLPVGQATPQVGKALSFAVRRDRMTVKAATDTNALTTNTIVGIVSELEYQGIYMKVTIKIDGSDTSSCVIYVEEMAFFAHPVTLGQRVEANWISEEGHSLLYS